MFERAMFEKLVGKMLQPELRKNELEPIFVFIKDNSINGK